MQTVNFFFAVNKPLVTWSEARPEQGPNRGQAQPGFFIPPWFYQGVKESKIKEAV